MGGSESGDTMAPKRKQSASSAKAENGKKSKGSGSGSSSDSHNEVNATLVNTKRIRVLKDGKPGDGPVLYWMSRDQRLQDNWALLYALEKAQQSNSSVVIAFNLVTEYLNAGARQFCFMLKGLKELEGKCKAHNLTFFLLKGDPVKNIPKLAQDLGAAMVVTDFSPVRLARSWRDKVSEKLQVPLHEIDAHNVVPVWVTSDKRESAARTIRPKIHKHLPEFLVDFPTNPKLAMWNGKPQPEHIDWDGVIKQASDAGSEVPEVDWAHPGEDAGHKMLAEFLTKQRLGVFHQKRNDPTAHVSDDDTSIHLDVPASCLSKGSTLRLKALSNLSPWRHFGQLSAQRIALEATKHKKTCKDGVDSFLEEMVVRRELSDNFCFYEQRYDSLSCCAEWAKQTLRNHEKDKREFIYSRAEFENGKTHDDLWNAAQLEMVHRGKMHGFMRMYWAKKILEWSRTPAEALETAIVLNDKYEIDGRDPNGYVGCIWSIGGIHDQGWREREVFGKIRYMNYNGCKRKFDVPKYVAYVQELIKHVKGKKK